MNISIANFKSIKEIGNFEIKPITILAGANSSGKSSFSQFLLLLKQSLEIKTSPLTLNEPYVLLDDYKKIIYRFDTQNKLSFGIELSNVDIHNNNSEIEQLLRKTFIANYNIASISLEVTFMTNEIIDELNLKIRFTNVEEHWAHYKLNETLQDYTITEHGKLFISDRQNITRTTENARVFFNAFMPLYSEILEKEIDLKGPKISFALTPLKNIVQNIFDQISYFGPFREEPQPYYTSSNPEIKKIGIRGENCVFVLESEKDKRIINYRYDNSTNNYIGTEETLLDAVNYWICIYFNLAESIKVEKVGSSYFSIVIKRGNISTTINHVGFGISQILPIIVEGLRMPQNGILLLDEPENHLHPKVQSQLFDFFRSLNYQGKKIIIETHSDHLITRMRRRIAEDLSNHLQNDISLIFIEESELGESLFRCLDFNEMGTLSMDYFPKDFTEQMNAEFRAIVKAQANKRKK